MTNLLSLLILFILTDQTFSAFTAPTWTINTLLNSGQHKAINGISTSPGIYNPNQPFQTAFASTPRVVLSLEGYKQNPPCTSCPVGFKISISAVSTSSFTSQVTVYGANMFYLCYMYLGISNTANLFYTDYQILQFSSGPLIDTNSNPRTYSQINTNPTGQSYPQYLTNKITNTIYLAGFKMNLGTTGTYINLTSSIVNETAHSIQIGTIADVQIFQVCYFRIAFDKTQVMASYVYVVDSWPYHGANNLQLPYTTTVGSSSFMYRNFLMGFSKIYIGTTTAATDFALQIIPSLQSIFTTACKTMTFTNATFKYLYGDTFHMRKRVCPGTHPYFLITTQLCYDVCIDRTFPVTDVARYCQLCHYSCLTCNGKLFSNCITCSSSDFRVFESSTNKCNCIIGYYDTNVHICSKCIDTCLTCQINANKCMSCTSAQHRTLNIPRSVCQCADGYYQTALNSPTVCVACDDKCMTCTLSANNCTSCDSTLHRVMDVPTSTCVCMDGYYQDIVGAGGCLPCTIVGCIKCQIQVTTLVQSCLQCANIRNFTLTPVSVGSVINNCSCIQYNFYNAPTVQCKLCSYQCGACNDLSACIACDTANYYRIADPASAFCICMDGYYDTGVSVCAVCMLPGCNKCTQQAATLQQTCIQCSSIDNFILFDTPPLTNCTCMSYTYYNSTSQVCIQCHYSCSSCVGPNQCTTCDSVSDYRFKNISLSMYCVCMDAYYQAIAGSRLCMPCTIMGCVRCRLDTITNTQTCLQCDNVNNYIVNSISASVNDCECTSLYYYNSINSQCTLCNYRCLTCMDSLSCSTCSSAVHHRIYDISVSQYCICMNGYYQIANTTICSTCDIKCMTCSLSATNCNTCDSTKHRVRVLAADAVSYTCACDNGYMESTTVYGLCVSTAVCGNGVVEAGQACDDNNRNDGDGCTSTCIIQQYHTCELYPNNNGTSLCYYSRPLSLQIDTILKVLDDNKISIVIKIQALLCNMETLKKYLQALTAIQLKQSNQRRLLQAQIIYISDIKFTITDPQKYTGYLTLILDYTQSISTLTNKQLKFVGSGIDNNTNGQKYFYATPVSKIALQDPHNKVPMIYYQKSAYSFSMILSYAFLAILSIYLVFFIISIFLKKSVIAIQLLIIFQFCYFCILSQTSVQLPLASLAYYGRYGTGINVNIIQAGMSSVVGVLTCPKMCKIYQQCNAIDNINMTFIIASCMLSAAIGLLVYKWKRQRDLDRMYQQKISIQMQNLDQNNTERNNNNASNVGNTQYLNQISSAKSMLNLTYQFSPKVSYLFTVMLQFVFGIYFLTTIEYLLTALSLNQQQYIFSIIWLSIIGVLFTIAWVLFYKMYPIAQQLSYISILRVGLQKLSIVKFAHLYMFVFLLVLGVILAAAPGIVVYVSIIVFAVVWLFLVYKKNIYRSGYNKIRSTVNQIITLIITILYILLEYVEQDGMGLPYIVVLLVMLIATLVNNVGFCIYEIWRENKGKKLKDLSDDQLQMNKVAIEEYSKYSSIKSDRNQATPGLPRIPVLERSQMSSPTSPKKNYPLLDQSKIKQIAKNKMDDLKTFRKQMKLGFSNNVADEKKVQIQSTLKKLDNSDPSQITHEKGQYSDL